MLEVGKMGRKGRRYNVMLKYSKKALVNTGQGAKRANPRVYTAPHEEERGAQKY